MGKYEQEFKAITEQIEASDSVSAFKDELIIAQERCDLLCQQEGAQAEILNLIQSLDQQWGRLNQKIYFSGEGLLITNQLNPEAISGREYDSGGVRDLVVVRVNFDNYPGVSEGFFIHTLPIRDSEGDIVGYKNSVLHRTRLDLPIVVNNTVFK